MLALEGNHPRLYGDVKAFFEDAEGRKLPGIDLALDRQVDGGHGRIEVRRYRATGDIGWLAQTNRWPGLQRLAMVQAERQESQWDEEVGARVWTTSTQRRLYISSLPVRAKRVARAVRSHWGIENQVHWVLDMSFGEDRRRTRNSRIRKGETPENVAVRRRIAMNLLRQNERPESLRQKRKRASWDDRFREEILDI